MHNYELLLRRPKELELELELQRLRLRHRHRCDPRRKLDSARLLTNPDTKRTRTYTGQKIILSVQGIQFTRFRFNRTFSLSNKGLNTFLWFCYPSIALRSYNSQLVKAEKGVTIFLDIFLFLKCCTQWWHCLIGIYLICFYETFTD